MLKKISRLKKHNLIKISRLKRVTLAEWTQINPSDPETIQQLTDAMTYGSPVQINYQGSGWRTIQPYGWNTSKDGNVLLMCYKDTGEVRSYRMDKIEDIFIDFDSSGPAIMNNPSMNNDDDLDSLVDNLNGGDNGVTFNIEDNYPDDMPPIPDMNDDEIQIEEGIYDEELQILENPISDINDQYTFNENISNEDINNEDINNETINQDNSENVEMEGENQNGENDI